MCLDPVGQVLIAFVPKYLSSCIRRPDGQRYHPPGRQQARDDRGMTALELSKVLRQRVRLSRPSVPGTSRSLIMTYEPKFRGGCTRSIKLTPSWNPTYVVSMRVSFSSWSGIQTLILGHDQWGIVPTLICLPERGTRSQGS